MLRTRTFAAGGFVCALCGVRNFFDLIQLDLESLPREFPAADPAEFAPLGPVEVCREFLIEPTVVRCRRCGSNFWVDNRD